MLVQRVASALVGIPIIIALILIGGTPYTAAVAVVLTLGVLEFYAITDPEHTIAPTTRLRYTTPSFFRPRSPALLGAASVALIIVAADSGFEEWTGAIALAI